MNKAVLVLLAVALLAGCATPVPPKATAVIKGMAMGSDGNAYARTPVTLDPGSRQTTTDAYGGFQFANLTAGAYTLHFEPSSGAPFDVAVKLTEGQEVDCMFMPGEGC